MSTRPSEELKDTANRLAQLIITGKRNSKQARQLQQSLSASRQKTADDRDSIQPPARQSREKEQPVGIWNATWIDGKKYFIRDAGKARQFAQWARVHQIPPKSQSKRVVFLGESVARGFLLDPLYTPASVLEQLLNVKPGELQAEVVDLALTNCDIDSLRQLCHSSLALEPDVMVIFAGNNWVDFFKRQGKINEEVLRALTGASSDQERFNGLKQFLHQHYKAMVKDFINALGNLSNTHRLPVVFVIPEFNLLDFSSTWLQQVNIWPRGETGKWLYLKEEIQKAWDNEDLEKVITLSREMIDLNQANPLGYEWLARCKIREELPREAEEYLRAALDTAIYRISDVPCCISVIRETILEEAPRHNITVVNLAEEFKQYQEGKLPGRELFLDYCHLTVEGIQVAMAAITRRLLQLLADKEIPLKELKNAAPFPQAEVIARSHFWAAFHNAHRGKQSYDILYHHCLKALDTSENIKNAMFEYAAMATRHTPWTLTKNLEQLVKNGDTQQLPTLIQPDKHYLMDIHLVDAVIDALHAKGIDIKDKVSSARKKEHGFINRQIDLLESYYYLISYESNFRPYDSYFRAIHAQSDFFLVANTEGDVTLKLTYRIPNTDGTLPRKEKVVMEINRSITLEIPANDQWTNISLQVPSHVLKDGINNITLRWPPQVKSAPHPGNRQPGKTRTNSILQMMYPVYGEIFDFIAETGA